jgi:type IV secretory pathway VirB10-like protein
MSDDKKVSPGGMSLPAEAVAKEKQPISLTGATPQATKIRKEIRLGVLAGFIIILLAIIIGVFKHGKGGGHRGGGPESAPMETVAPSGKKNVEELKALSEKKRAGRLEEGRELGADGDGQGAGDGDVGNDLNLPPTKIARASGLTGRPGGPGGRPGYGGSAGSQGYGSAGGRMEDASERADLAEANLARRSSLSVRGGSGGGGMGGMKGKESADVVDPGIRALQERVAALAGQGTGGAPSGGGLGAVPGQSGGQQDQNMQANKAAFLESARKGASQNVQRVSLVKPLTKYEVQAGWDIPATLEQAINSDLPGEVRGLVRENVYDTSTGHYLLIPQGARVVGEYSSRVAYGQSSVQVVWTRLIFPDGSSVDLGGLNGQDVRGQSGFRDKVDNHYVRLISAALLTSAFAAGIEMTQNQSATATVLTPSQLATQAVGQQLGELGTRITERNLDIQPTIKISIGYRFTIRVRKDLVFDRPYGGG